MYLLQNKYLKPKKRKKKLPPAGFEPGIFH